MPSSLDEVAKIATNTREGIQLRDTLLAMVIGIALMECFLANRKKPVREQQASAAPAAETG